MDELKNRQFAIISYLRSTVRGLQGMYEEVLSGKVEEFCLEKCSKCKRILRVTTGEMQQKPMRSQLRHTPHIIQPDPVLIEIRPSEGSESPIIHK
jgi:hypothetical protein